MTAATTRCDAAKMDPLNTEQWDQVKELFELLLDVPAGDRPAVVSGKSDDRVTDVVLTLLRIHESTRGAQRGCETPPGWRRGSVVAGRYRIERLIGTGATAEVYEAYDEVVAVPCALKMLTAQAADVPVLVQRLRDSVLMSRQVRHGSICQVFDYGETGAMDEAASHPFITMQLCDGATPLQSVLERRPLTQAQALALAERLAGALDTLHARGWVHGDVSPANVLVRWDMDQVEAVWLTDFGLVHRAVTSDVESSRELLGTPYYLAPEVLAGAEPSAWSDQYALALLLDYSISRIPAYAVTSLGELICQKVLDHPTSLLVRAPHLSTVWQRTIRRATFRHASERFGSCGELLAALKAGCSDAEAPAPAAGPGLLRAKRLSLLSITRMFVVAFTLSLFAQGLWLAFNSDNDTQRPCVTLWDFGNPLPGAADGAFPRQLTFELASALLADGRVILNNIAAAGSGTCDRPGIAGGSRYFTVRGYLRDDAGVNVLHVSILREGRFEIPYRNLTFDQYSLSTGWAEVVTREVVRAALTGAAEHTGAGQEPPSS